jgi:Predicted periplasmic lipoprotein (DUF2279)
VVTRLLDSARGRWPRALALLAVLLLAVPGPLAAQDSSWRPSVTPADDPSLAPVEPVFSKRSCPDYRLLPDGSGDCEPWMASANLTTGAPLQIAQADAQRPPVGEAREPNRLIGRLVPVGAWAGVAANSLLGYSHQSFHTANEGWFGPNTEDGGADKTSHFADYYIVSKEMAFLYEKLGYSENEARWWGLGIAVTTGLVNEIGDGFTWHGFAWQDFAMDTFGAATATLISATRTEDLLGIRGSHLPPQQYAHDVYSADLKLSGLGRRLGVNLGPLRWLLLSVTYASKGYEDHPPTEQLQRQVGFEIGLNLQQILNDLGVKRDTWWGYALHVVGDNIRFPYTAVGMRVDLNHGKWHGPNNGNYP